MKASEVAERLQTSVETIRKWSNEGLIGTRIGLGHRKIWRYTAQEIRELVGGKDNSHDSTPIQEPMPDKGKYK